MTCAPAPLKGGSSRETEDGASGATSVGDGNPRPGQVGCTLRSPSSVAGPRGRGLPDRGRRPQPARAPLTKAGLQFPACSGPWGDGGRWLRRTRLLGAGPGWAPEPVPPEGSAGSERALHPGPARPGLAPPASRLPPAGAPPLAPPQPGGLAGAAARRQHHSRRRRSAPSPSVFLSFSGGSGGEGGGRGSSSRAGCDE